jgi:hypothetical protein
MRAIGVASIIIGVMFALIGLLMAIVGGGFIPFSDENAAGLAGEFVMTIGIGTVLANAALIGGGVGVLRVAPWGRSLCIAHAAVAGIVYGAWLIGGDIDMFFVAALAYAVALIWLFYGTSWKAAFRGAMLRTP